MGSWVFVFVDDENCMEFGNIARDWRNGFSEYFKNKKKRFLVVLVDWYSPSIR